MNEETFEYWEFYYPPLGQGSYRCASALLHRSSDRRFWTDGCHKWILDDFGMLHYVHD